MKKLLQLITMGLFVLFAVACRHSKEAETVTSTSIADTEPKDVIKDVFTDEDGAQMEVSINNTDNTAIIHLEGKTYELKKSRELPEYTASNAEYQYSNIKGRVTFLKKDYDMVMFRNKKDQPSASSKMASY
ncbi:hypothetical protein ACM39_17395 [Chryseobacterium sp. FH2]|uniref:hypothetical protein n=1 Tax=Chryseobacterium sp. FH2 TaxID=1674291 RepID=UPI00065AE225|nr:hypothetical protein [Chryseobacterium sp. FH2]KMQ62891.1 hypothetical protein ACM39_17395 [Chryseobacterium sp. FH2]